MTTRATALINWPAIGKASRKLSPNGALWLTKSVNRFTATGRWKKWEHSRCPRCGETKEDTLHVLLCEDDEAKENLYESVTEFETWMENYGTHTAIRNIFTTTILEQQQTSLSITARFILHNDNPPHLGQLIQNPASEQDEIGFNTLEGKISSKWKEAQDEYYEITNEKRKTGVTWLAWMIKKLYSITKSQWTHRNEVLLLQSTYQASQEELAQLKSEIRKEFELGDGNILGNGIALFTVNEDDVKIFTVDEQKAWLKSVSHRGRSRT